MSSLRTARFLSFPVVVTAAALLVARGASALPGGTAQDGPRVVETACNGVDDDGDQLVDVLLPVGANACTTRGRGACHDGFAACERGQRVCLAPPPTPEVKDGVDNDCNGVVDDVAPVAAAIHGRALVLAPPYAQKEAAADLANVASSLAQAGVPFDRPTGDAAWTAALEQLGAGDRYALAVVPGYLMGSAVSGAAGEKLRHFVERGGVLVLFKPIGSAGMASAWELAGLRRSARHRDVESLRFEDTLPAALAAIDSPEERTVPINRPAAAARTAAATAPERVEVYALEPDPTAGTQVVARGQVGALSFPVFTRRPLGKGAVYALGHDLSTFAAPRCYLNCFEPSGDLLRLFLLGALREATAGHLVTLATAPDGASSALLLLHDLDALEATYAVVGNEPAAVQMAQMESAHHARATFAFTTEDDERLPAPSLCALGMCAAAAHGVHHPSSFAALPRGTCDESFLFPGYESNHPTVCGEVAVAAKKIAGQFGHRPRLWTSPYLAPNPALFSVLVEEGFLFDAGFAVGDLPYNLPVDTSAIGSHQERFQHAAMLEFPVAGEDALEVPTGATGVAGATGTSTHRLDLDARSARRFTAMWDYLALRNADNESASTILSHLRIHGGGEPYLPAKLQAVAAMLEDVTRARYGQVRALPVETMGDFWRARLASALEESYDEAHGYSGDLTIGADTAPGLTLEFGDAVTRFDCAACGPARIAGQRVVLLNAPKPHARLHFVAAVR